MWEALNEEERRRKELRRGQISTDEVHAEALEAKCAQHYENAIKSHHGSTPGSDKWLEAKNGYLQVLEEVRNSTCTVRSTMLEQLIFLATKNLANILEREGDKKGAVVYYATAADIDDSDISIWFKLGSLAADLGRLRLARFALEQGLALQNGHLLSRGLLCEILLLQKDFVTCDKLVSSWLEENPNDALALLLKSHLLEETHDAPLTPLDMFAESAQSQADKLRRKAKFLCPSVCLPLYESRKASEASTDHSKKKEDREGGESRVSSIVLRAPLSWKQICNAVLAALRQWDKEEEGLSVKETGRDEAAAQETESAEQLPGDITHSKQTKTTGLSDDKDVDGACPTDSDSATKKHSPGVEGQLPDKENADINVRDTVVRSKSWKRGKSGPISTQLVRFEIRNLPCADNQEKDVTKQGKREPQGLERYSDAANAQPESLHDEDTRKFTTNVKGSPDGAGGQVKDASTNDGAAVDADRRQGVHSVAKQITGKSNTKTAARKKIADRTQPRRTSRRITEKMKAEHEAAVALGRETNIKYKLLEFIRHEGFGEAHKGDSEKGLCHGRNEREEEDQEEEDGEDDALDRLLKRNPWRWPPVPDKLLPVSVSHDEASYAHTLEENPAESENNNAEAALDARAPKRRRAGSSMPERESGAGHEERGSSLQETGSPSQKRRRTDSGTSTSPWERVDWALEERQVGAFVAALSAAPVPLPLLPSLLHRHLATLSHQRLSVAPNTLLHLARSPLRVQDARCASLPEALMEAELCLSRALELPCSGAASKSEEGQTEVGEGQRGDKLNNSSQRVQGIQADDGGRAAYHQLMQGGLAALQRCFLHPVVLLLTRKEEAMIARHHERKRKGIRQLGSSSERDKAELVVEKHSADADVRTKRTVKDSGPESPQQTLSASELKSEHKRQKNESSDGDASSQNPAENEVMDIPKSSSDQTTSQPTNRSFAFTAASIDSFNPVSGALGISEPPLEGNEDISSASPFTKEERALWVRFLWLQSVVEIEEGLKAPAMSLLQRCKQLLLWGRESPQPKDCKTLGGNSEGTREEAGGTTRKDSFALGVGVRPPKQTPQRRRNTSPETRRASRSRSASESDTGLSESAHPSDSDSNNPRGRSRGRGRPRGRAPRGSRGRGRGRRRTQSALNSSGLGSPRDEKEVETSLPRRSIVPEAVTPRVSLEAAEFGEYSFASGTHELPEDAVPVPHCSQWPFLSLKAVEERLLSLKKVSQAEQLRALFDAACAIDRANRMVEAREREEGEHLERKRGFDSDRELKNVSETGKNENKAVMLERIARAQERAKAEKHAFKKVVDAFKEVFIGADGEPKRLSQLEEHLSSLVSLSHLSTRGVESGEYEAVDMTESLHSGEQGKDHEKEEREGQRGAPGKQSEAEDGKTCNAKSRNLIQMLVTSSVRSGCLWPCVLLLEALLLRIVNNNQEISRGRKKVSLLFSVPHSRSTAGAEEDDEDDEVEDDAEEGHSGPERASLASHMGQNGTLQSKSRAVNQKEDTNSMKIQHLLLLLRKVLSFMVLLTDADCATHQARTAMANGVSADLGRGVSSASFHGFAGPFFDLDRQRLINSAQLSSSSSSSSSSSTNRPTTTTSLSELFSPAAFVLRRRELLLLLACLPVRLHKSCANTSASPPPFATSPSSSLLLPVVQLALRHGQWATAVRSVGGLIALLPRSGLRLREPQIQQEASGALQILSCLLLLAQRLERAGAGGHEAWVSAQAVAQQRSRTAVGAVLRDTGEEGPESAQGLLAGDGRLCTTLTVAEYRHLLAKLAMIIKISEFSTTHLPLLGPSTFAFLALLFAYYTSVTYRAYRKQALTLDACRGGEEEHAERALALLWAQEAHQRRQAKSLSGPVSVKTRGKKEQDDIAPGAESLQKNEPEAEDNKSALGGYLRHLATHCHRLVAATDALHCFLTSKKALCASPSVAVPRYLYAFFAPTRLSGGEAGDRPLQTSEFGHGGAGGVAAAAATTATTTFNATAAAAAGFVEDEGETETEAELRKKGWELLFGASRAQNPARRRPMKPLLDPDDPLALALSPEVKEPLYRASCIPDSFSGLAVNMLGHVGEELQLLLALLRRTEARDREKTAATVGGKGKVTAESGVGAEAKKKGDSSSSSAVSSESTASLTSTDELETDVFALSPQAAADVKGAEKIWFLAMDQALNCLHHIDLSGKAVAAHAESCQELEAALSLDPLGLVQRLPFMPLGSTSVIPRALTVFAHTLESVKRKRLTGRTRIKAALDRVYQAVEEAIVIASLLPVQEASHADRRLALCETSDADAEGVESTVSDDSLAILAHYESPLLADYALGPPLLPAPFAADIEAFLYAAVAGSRSGSRPLSLTGIDKLERVSTASLAPAASASLVASEDVHRRRLWRKFHGAFYFMLARNCPAPRVQGGKYRGRGTIAPTNVITLSVTKNASRLVKGRCVEEDWVARKLDEEQGMGRWQELGEKHSEKAQEEALLYCWFPFPGVYTSSAGVVQRRRDEGKDRGTSASAVRDPHKAAGVREEESYNRKEHQLPEHSSVKTKKQSDDEGEDSIDESESENEDDDELEPDASAGSQPKQSGGSDEDQLEFEESSLFLAQLYLKDLSYNPGRAASWFHLGRRFRSMATLMLDLYPKTLEELAEEDYKYTRGILSVPFFSFVTPPAAVMLGRKPRHLSADTHEKGSGAPHAVDTSKEESALKKRRLEQGPGPVASVSEDGASGRIATALSEEHLEVMRREMAKARREKRFLRRSRGFLCDEGKRARAYIAAYRSAAVRCFKVALALWTAQRQLTSGASDAAADERAARPSQISYSRPESDLLGSVGLSGGVEKEGQCCLQGVLTGVVAYQKGDETEDRVLHCHEELGLLYFQMVQDLPHGDPRRGQSLCEAAASFDNAICEIKKISGVAIDLPHLPPLLANESHKDSSEQRTSAPARTAPSSSSLCEVASSSSTPTASAPSPSFRKPASTSNPNLDSNRASTSDGHTNTTTITTTTTTNNNNNSNSTESPLPLSEQWSSFLLAGKCLHKQAVALRRQQPAAGDRADALEADAMDYYLQALRCVEGLADAADAATAHPNADSQQSGPGTGSGTRFVSALSRAPTAPAAALAGTVLAAQESLEACDSVSHVTEHALEAFYRVHAARLKLLLPSCPPLTLDPEAQDGAGTDELEVADEITPEAKTQQRPPAKGTGTKRAGSASRNSHASPLLPRESAILPFSTLQVACRYWLKDGKDICEQLRGCEREEELEERADKPEETSKERKQEGRGSESSPREKEKRKRADSASGSAAAATGSHSRPSSSSEISSSSLSHSASDSSSSTARSSPSCSTTSPASSFTLQHCASASCLALSLSPTVKQDPRALARWRVVAVRNAVSAMHLVLATDQYFHRANYWIARALLVLPKLRQAVRDFDSVVESKGDSRGGTSSVSSSLPSSFYSSSLSLSADPKADSSAHLRGEGGSPAPTPMVTRSVRTRSASAEEKRVEEEVASCYSPSSSGPGGRFRPLLDSLPASSCLNVSPEDAVGVSAALSVLSRLFDRRRPQIVAVWIQEKSGGSSWCPVAALQERRRKFDAVRLKYVEFYLSLLAFAGPGQRYRQLRVLFSWLVGAKDLHHQYEQRLVRAALGARMEVLSRLAKRLMQEMDAAAEKNEEKHGRGSRSKTGKERHQKSGELDQAGVEQVMRDSKGVGARKDLERLAEHETRRTEVSEDGEAAKTRKESDQPLSSSSSATTTTISSASATATSSACAHGPATSSELPLTTTGASTNSSPRGDRSSGDLLSLLSSHLGGHAPPESPVFSMEERQEALRQLLELVFDLYLDCCDQSGRLQGADRLLLLASNLLLVVVEMVSSSFLSPGEDLDSALADALHSDLRRALKEELRALDLVRGPFRPFPLLGTHRRWRQWSSAGNIFEQRPRRELCALAERFCNDLWPDKQGKGRTARPRLRILRRTPSVAAGRGSGESQPRAGEPTAQDPQPLAASSNGRPVEEHDMQSFEDGAGPRA